jgi:MerR family transcriptional regulator, light-induced transcriptional regulator
MNTFSIRDIENLSGIKAHTLRIWEQRYHLFQPKRKDSNHRFYDNEDLKHILRIAYLYHNGYKISKIAKLPETDIRRLATENLNGSNSFDVFINQLMEASIDYDQERFERIIHTANQQLGFEKNIYQVIYPFLQKIGLLWMTDNMLPAQEHFASHLIRKKIIVAIDGLDHPLPGSRRTVLLYTPEGEHHEIPLLLTKYHLKKNGIKTVYLGTNIPLTEIVAYLQHKKVTHIYFHLITQFLLGQIDEYVKKILALFPHIELVISGPVATKITAQAPNLRVLHSKEDMIRFTREEQ